MKTKHWTAEDVRRRDRLRAIMAGRGYTSVDVARLTHKAAITVRQYRSGYRVIPPDFLELLEYKSGFKRNQTMDDESLEVAK